MDDTCEWVCEYVDVYTKHYATACKHKHRRKDSDERFIFCPYCGKKIKEKK